MPSPAHPAADQRRAELGPMALRPGEHPTAVCPLCRGPASPEALREVAFYPLETIEALHAEHPDWRVESGACPACVQQVLLETLLHEGDEALHDAVQAFWPLDARAAFGALPTPLRLHADPRFTGRGVTVAFVDAAFHPHPDLTTPQNRILAWADATGARVEALRFGPDEVPQWPGWDAAADAQWHGTMTSTVGCGNGALSRGLYRGLACEAKLVLVQVRQATGEIDNASIARALIWLGENAGQLALGVVNLSVGGELARTAAEDVVGAAVRALVGRGVVVVAAAGNDGVRRLVPPATAPEAITVGGIDDRNTFDHGEIELWHSNYGVARSGVYKPELVAPSAWVVAPVLPGSAAAEEAAALFARRFAGGAGTPRPDVEQELLARGLVTPFYQHVDGTSFAAPLVSSVAACLLEANRELAPALLREVLLTTAHSVPDAPRERQGSGAVEAGRAVALALAQRHGHAALAGAPHLEGEMLVFQLHDGHAEEVEVFGSWNGWSAAAPARPVRPGLWEARIPRPETDRVTYKFRIDRARWLDDPANPRKAPDGVGGLNAVVRLDPPEDGPGPGSGSV
jgi:serine protease AprX